jgi:hypothetical protein
LRMRDSCEWISTQSFSQWIGHVSPHVALVNHNDVQEDIGWLSRESLSLSPRSSHFLHVVVHVVVVKMDSLRSLEREKSLSFWVLLIGTHPRVGKHSQLRKIAGLTPVIRKIRDYTLSDYDPDIDTKINKIMSQLQILFSICKLRKLVVEILQIPEEIIGLNWKCKLC